MKAPVAKAHKAGVQVAHDWAEWRIFRVSPSTALVARRVRTARCATHARTRYRLLTRAVLPHVVNATRVACLDADSRQALHLRYCRPDSEAPVYCTT